MGHLPLLKPQGSLMVEPPLAGGHWPGRVLFTRSQTPTSHCVVCPLVECPLKESLVLNKSPLSKHSLSSYSEPGSWFVTDRKRNKIMFPTSWRLNTIWWFQFICSLRGTKLFCHPSTYSIPGLGRSAAEGIGYPLQYSWASLVAQMVKNPPTVQETWVRSLGWEDPLEMGKATHSSVLAWRIPWTV